MAERDVLHERIAEANDRYQLLVGTRSILVGVSGGQDSVALLHALVSIAELKLKVAAAHLHHEMRGEEADADEQYVRELAASLGADFFTERRDVLEDAARDGVNVEVAGRRARYEFLERVADKGGFDRIGTAHTGTDRVETLLLNIFRGAGLEGLRSIPPRRGKIVRPLILASRAETGEYCQRHGLHVRIDRSNLEPDYARRNALRLNILPQIAEEFPGLEPALLRVCESIEEELAWTQPLVEEALAAATTERSDERIALAVEKLGELPRGALHRVLRAAVEQARGNLQDVSREQIEHAAGLTRNGHTGKRVALPGGWQVARGYDEIAVERGRTDEPLADESVPLPVPGSARLEARRVEVTAERVAAPSQAAGDDPLVALIDERAAAPGLVLRSWKPGERFQPLGMTGTKKLHDFFVDEKVPRRDRDRTPVLADAQGRILWVVGYRLSHLARLTEGAQQAVRLTARFDE